MPTPRKTPAPKTPTKRAPRRATPDAYVNATDERKLSGIAAKRAQLRGEDGPQVDPYAPTVWGTQEASGSLVDLVLPSGQVCLAQRPGPEGLMAAGLLNDLDMIATVLPKVSGGKGETFDASQLMKNRVMMKQAMDLMNRVTVHVVIKPELHDEPDNPADREPGKIYPSSVSMEDKSFLFNWAVGGTRDLAKFRREFTESVASVDAGEGSALPAE